MEPLWNLHFGKSVTVFQNKDVPELSCSVLKQVCLFSSKVTGKWGGIKSGGPSDPSDVQMRAWTAHSKMWLG